MPLYMFVPFHAVLIIRWKESVDVKSNGFKKMTYLHILQVIPFSSPDKNNTILLFWWSLQKMCFWKSNAAVNKYLQTWN